MFAIVPLGHNLTKSHPSPIHKSAHFSPQESRLSFLSVLLSPTCTPNILCGPQLHRTTSPPIIPPTNEHPFPSHTSRCHIQASFTSPPLNSHFPSPPHRMTFTAKPLAGWLGGVGRCLTGACDWLWEAGMRGNLHRYIHPPLY